MYIKKPMKTPVLVNDVIIMLDTETSKEKLNTVCENYVVAWTISIRAYHMNICTLYGNRPSECIECINLIMKNLIGAITYMYIFNLSFDWVFLRKFLIREYGIPVKQLNTKAHYPIYIEFGNGLILRDALILAQCKLEKWASDLNVEHQKAVGQWDYDQVRTQDHVFTENELIYIENDTLAGVECLDGYMTALNKNIYNMPWTATGIPREEVQKRGKANNGHDTFLRQVLEYDQQKIMQMVYHGGYVHGNRYYYDLIVRALVQCFDFASSYPFCLYEKFPCEKFTPVDNCRMQDILNDKENAFYFKLIAINVDLKDHLEPMPTLQFSKCVKTVNADIDNGRIITAEYLEIWLTEVDLEVISKQYTFEKHICVSVHAAYKDYLPRWFTDYVFELFRQKTMLKGGDPVQYAIAKGRLNSLYGMCVQKPVPVTLLEDYETGEYNQDTSIDPEEEYAKFVKRRKNVLNYQTGVWVTAYAFRNLFRLGSCCETWLYSDTDSCFGINWDPEKIRKYNDDCKAFMVSRGYGCVEHNGREYWLGIAELDKEFTEFKVVGSKRYCGRSVKDGKLHITVAGVPKVGAVALKDDISNFTSGMIFPGTVTGKKTHTYFYKDEIEIMNGIEYGDSIDLSPCDYLLKSEFSWGDLHTEYMEVNVYE